MPTMHEGFHAQDGWYFERLEGGGVKISAAVNRSTETTALSAEAWASVVAAMSAAGETSDTYIAALAAQRGS